jgi:fibro-slime domain-containing protein
LACGLGCGNSDDGIYAMVGDGGRDKLDGGGGDARLDGGGRDSRITARPDSTASSGDGGEDENCGALVARIRDFSPDTHPDFESFGGGGATTGIVESMLDADHLPVFRDARNMVTSQESFDQWYRTESGVNQELSVELELTARGSGVYVYESSAFFPIDGQGFGNYGGTSHNFHFTTQIATSFTYRGGENFMFRGDDDLWIFVNDRLALDLGGLHGAISGNIDFDDLADQLGITQGETYRMDIFHAERHTSESNFQISTTISCFMPPII